MSGHLFVGDVYARFIPAAPCHSGFQIVRHDDLRHSFEEFKSAQVRADPVGQVLCPCDVGKGVVAGAEYVYEQLRLPDFAGCRILNRDCGSGVIDEQLLAGPVLLSKNNFLLLSPALI